VSFDFLLIDAEVSVSVLSFPNSSASKGGRFLLEGCVISVEVRNGVWYCDCEGGSLKAQGKLDYSDRHGRERNELTTEVVDPKSVEDLRSILT
jgi:hypothetical protein